MLGRVPAPPDSVCHPYADATDDEQQQAHEAGDPPNRCACVRQHRGPVAEQAQVPVHAQVDQFGHVPFAVRRIGPLGRVNVVASLGVGFMGVQLGVQPRSGRGGRKTLAVAWLQQAGVRVGGQLPVPVEDESRVEWPYPFCIHQLRKMRQVKRSAHVGDHVARVAQDRHEHGHGQNTVCADKTVGDHWRLGAHGLLVIGTFRQAGPIDSQLNRERVHQVQVAVRLQYVEHREALALTHQRREQRALVGLDVLRHAVDRRIDPVRVRQLLELGHPGQEHEVALGLEQLRLALGSEHACPGLQMRPGPFQQNALKRVPQRQRHERDPDQHRHGERQYHPTFCRNRQPCALRPFRFGLAFHAVTPRGASQSTRCSESPIVYVTRPHATSRAQLLLCAPPISTATGVIPFLPRISVRDRITPGPGLS